MTGFFVGILYGVTLSVFVLGLALGHSMNVAFFIYVILFLLSAISTIFVYQCNQLNNRLNEIEEKLKELGIKNEG